jgi:hypothetical protein
MLRSFYLLTVVALFSGLTSCQHFNPTDSLKSHIDVTINQFDNDVTFVASLVPFASLENQLTLPDKEHPEQIATLNDQLKQLDEHILAVEAYDNTTQGIKEEMLVLCRQELAQYAMTRLEESIADRHQQRHRYDRDAAHYTETFSTKILAHYADANLMANLHPTN